MAHSTQAVVIGAGPGGYVAAIRLAQLGVKTTIIERKKLGGVCLNVGCIPSKAYISAAKVFHNIETAGELGITVDKPKVDMAKMKTWKDSVVTRLTTGVRALLEKAGVEIIEGAASFSGPNSLTIDSEGKKSELKFEKAIIATGSRSTEIPPFPYDGVKVISSTHALDLTEVPEDFVVIGGGVIGVEIGMYMNRFGSKVTIVEMLDSILSVVDPEITKVLTRTMKKRKVKVHTKTKALGFTEKNGKCAVQIEDAKGKKSEIPADKILVAVGRKPNVETLALEKAGVKKDDRGFIPIDKQLRTNQPHIFAIGDIAGGALLAHKASKEGLVAAAVIAGQKEEFDVRAMPWGIFTDPEIGSVGMTEDEAKAAGHEVRVGRFPFAALGRALAMRETDGMVKLIADAKTDQVLGCHIIGPDASDIVAEATLAIELGATIEDIALTVHAHPTLMEGMMEAAEAVHGKAVHIFNP